ncbi:MAG: DNA-3-methyladenine glycosylase family protein [Jatrophihabitans sp.]
MLPNLADPPLSRSVPVHSWRDVMLTLGPLRRGVGDPSMRLVGGVLWRAAPTPHGPVTLALRPGAGALHASAFGPGAAWSLDRLPTLLGLDQDWTDLALDSLPRLRDVHRAHPGLRLPATGVLLEPLMGAVLEQKVTGLEARASWRALLQRYGQVAPGPSPAGLRVIPDAAALLAVPTWGWHRAGVDLKRQRAIRAVATVAAGLERGIELPAEQVRSRLQLVPGIGPWTAAETTQRALGDGDAVSVGDYHIPNQVVFALTGRPRGTDAEMLELLEPWRGQRQRIVRLIEVAGIGAPRFGPRMAPGRMPMPRR